MRRILGGMFLAFSAALTLAACGRQPSPAAPSSAQPATAPADLPARPRIVSTVPAATLNLVLIGAADELVGVTKYDALFLPDAQKNLPVVGDYETMNYEELVKLKPTALVIQTAESRIPERLKQTAEQEHIELVNMRFDHVADIWTSVEALGKVSGKETEATGAIQRAQAELKSIAREYKNAPHPKVVYLVSTSHMWISGDKTFTHEMIVAAGGDDVGAKVGEGFPDTNRETLVKLQPEVLLLGAVEEMGPMENDPRISPWQDLPIPAATHNRIYLVTAANSQMASVDIGKNVRELAEMIHAGDPRPPETGAATGGAGGSKP